MKMFPRRRTLRAYCAYLQVATATVFLTQVVGLEGTELPFDPFSMHPTERSLLDEMMRAFRDLAVLAVSRGSITMLCLLLYVGTTGMLLGERAILTSADAEPVARPMTGRALVLDIVFLVLPCLLAGACFWTATGLAQADGFVQLPALVVALVPWILGVALVEGFAAMSARSRDGAPSGMGHESG